jgi:TolB-like protein/class 3 adenylate cyclase/Flp pilus assembly protein TadD
VEPRPIERKLAAILAADMVGYSRLMEADEAGTLAQLKALRQQIIEPKIGARRGRIVKTTGDGMLVEFASVAEAVQTAVEIQQALAERNASIPADRQALFRIGVNLGEIIIEGDDIYGNGVNVAARLEGLAEPGGICISSTVYEQIESILNLGYQDLGEQKVKNISKPIRGYSVQVKAERLPMRDMVPDRGDEAEEVAVREAPRAAPSIAVLPFTNMSADAEQEFFADGMTEDIITALSKISGMLVIARNSTFSYKGKAIDARRVSHDLGVSYLLEGSVRTAGQKVRITAQLIDAEDGGHVWAARFDRDLTDIFALQDEITSNVVTALHVRLVEGEQARVWHKSTENLGAWECLMQGLTHFRRFVQEENTRARALFEKAAELDSDYAAARVWLAWTYWAEARFLWTESPNQATARAAELAEQALGLDGSLSETHSLLGAIHLMRRDYGHAIAAGEKAIALDPNGADVPALLAMTLNWSGRAEEAGALIDKAMRLSPLYSAWYLAVQAHAHRLTGRLEAAAACYGDSLARNPNHIGPRIGLTACYAEMGREAEARAQAAEVLRINPKFTLAKYAESLTYKDPAASETALTALRQAGLPE